jgi:hypothetical protein
MSAGLIVSSRSNQPKAGSTKDIAVMRSTAPAFTERKVSKSEMELTQ